MGVQDELTAGWLVGPWVFRASASGVLSKLLPIFFSGKITNLLSWYFDGRISEIHNACCLGWFYFVTPVVVVNRW